VRLAEYYDMEHQRGASIVISNSTSAQVIDLYQKHGFSINRVKSRRVISSKGVAKEIVTDILAIL